MQVNVLVVEDHPTQRRSLVKHLRKIEKVNNIYEASNAAEMFMLLETNKDINALILDIDLGEDSDNGLEAYSYSREEGYDLPAILLTGSQFDASLSYNIGIQDVISKSLIFNFSRLEIALQRLSSYYRYKKFIDCGGVCVPVCGEKNVVLFPTDILFIESINGLVYVHTENDTYSTNLRLNFYEEILGNSNFCLVHRSYLVNFTKIDTYTNDCIVVKDNTIPISKDKREKVDRYFSLCNKPSRHFFNFKRMVGTWNV